jgi:hypothetical protein
VHREKARERRTLTSWRIHRKEQVRTGKEPSKATHSLESVEKGISRDSKRKRARDGHPLAGEYQVRERLCQ